MIYSIQTAWYHELGNWLLDVILWIPRYIFALFVDFIAWAWAFVASAVGSVTSLYQGYWAPVMAGPVGYWADVTNIAFGMATILSAYILRFLIRRIPVVG